MSNEFPKSISSSVIEIIPGVEMHVHVLNNGERVIEADDLQRFFEWLGDSGQLNDEVALRLAKAVKGL